MLVDVTIGLLVAIAKGGTAGGAVWVGKEVRVAARRVLVGLLVSAAAVAVPAVAVRVGGKLVACGRVGVG